MLFNSILSNIWKLYIIKSVRWFLVSMPIITLFFKDNGLTNTDIFILQSAFALGLILFEIPSGYFSDVIGRKQSIIVGTILAIIGLGLYTQSAGFWGFLFSELILGLSSSFISGTDSALMYDSLLQENKEKEHKKYMSYMQSIGAFSESTAAILGGFLAITSLRLPITVEFFVSIIALPIAFSLIEPKFEKHTNEKGAFHGIKEILRYVLFQHKEIFWLIFFVGFFGSTSLVMTWTLQLYFSEINLPVEYFGIMWAVLNFSIIIFGFFIPKIETSLGKKKSLFLLMIAMSAGIIGFIVLKSYVALLFGFLLYFARAFSSVVTSDYVNKLVESKVRATILSIQGLFVRLLFAIIGPLIGYFHDNIGLSQSLTILLIIFLTGTSIAIYYLNKNKVL